MTEAQKKLEAWFEEYVPDRGPAETVGGEIVRAAERIAYRWYNDGDMIYHGYGNRTVNSSWRFLRRQAGLDAEEPARYEEDEYGRFIEELCSAVAGYLEDRPELFGRRNFTDSVQPSESDIAAADEAERYEFDDDYYLGDEEY